MKKTRIFTLLFLIAILSVCLFAGCGKKGETVSSVSLKDYDPNTVIEIALGDFDCSEYTLAVVYESGHTEDIILTEEMISDTDFFKLYQIGDHEITVNYGKQKYTFKVSVKRASFGELSFPENNVFTYDGKAHTVEVDGNIPANANVTYIGGNSFVNAGTYDLTAIVSCEGYATQKLSTKVTVERAKYDMSAVSFESKEFVYDGSAHSLAISGTLPKGVSSPIYTVNEKITSSATEVGEYKVIAAFTNNDPNYEDIPPMEATLKITPAEYTVKGVDIVFKNENGIIISDATKIYDGKTVTFDINDYNKLSKKVSVAFSVLDKEGNVISSSNKNTNIINAGIYTVKVDFTHTDGKNYKPLEPIVRTFEVLKAEYPPIENLRLPSAQATYDGKEHSIEIEGELPDGVTVSYEYYRENTLVVDADGNPVQAVTDPGIYTVKAIFTHNDENLGDISEIVATFNIQKATLSIHIIGFSNENSVFYSGQPYEPKFTTWKEAVGIDYDILQYSKVKYYVYDSDSLKYVELGENELPTEIGSYRAAIDVSIADEYKHIYEFEDKSEAQTIVKQFDILKKELEIPTVEFTSEPQITYNGEGKQINYTSNADLELVTVSTAYFKYVSGEYVIMPSGELPVNVGSYKCVLTISLSNTDNYVFENGENNKQFSFEFEIVPMTIDVSGLTFDAVEFMYNNTSQMPSLNNIPLHVKSSVRLYLITNEVVEIANDQAINAGKYRCDVTLRPESSNYILSGNTTYSTEFKISPKIIADLDDLLNIEFEITFGEGTYTDDSLAEVIGKALFGDMSKKIQCRIGSIYSITEEKYVSAENIVTGGKYTVKCRLDAADYNYALWSESLGRYVYGIEKEFHFNFV